MVVFFLSVDNPEIPEAVTVMGRVPMDDNSIAEVFKRLYPGDEAFGIPHSAWLEHVVDSAVVLDGDNLRAATRLEREMA